MWKVKHKLKKGEEVKEDVTNKAEAELEANTNDETKGGVKEKLECNTAEAIHRKVQRSIWVPLCCLYQGETSCLLAVVWSYT